MNTVLVEVEGVRTWPFSERIKKTKWAPRVQAGFEEALSRLGRFTLRTIRNAPDAIAADEQPFEKPLT